MTEASRTVKLTNKLGLHARAAASFVKAAQQFKSKVYVEYKDQQVNGNSILDILTLACPRGGSLTIKADGADAAAAVEELERLVNNKFGED